MSNLALNFSEAKHFDFKIKVLENILIDRKSKYTVVGWTVKFEEQVSLFIQTLLKKKYFQKASHNSYAYRIELKNWAVLEWKNDDWETGAGNCILRELQREGFVNVIVVVTRYFWGVYLNTDRFKNVINVTKEFLED